MLMSKPMHSTLTTVQVSWTHAVIMMCWLIALHRYWLTFRWRLVMRDGPDLPLKDA